MNKKFLACILSLFLCMGMTPITTYAEENSVVQDGVDTENDADMTGDEVSTSQSTTLETESDNIVSDGTDVMAADSSNEMSEKDKKVPTNTSRKVPKEKNALSGNCGKQGQEQSVQWSLEQNNEDANNPTYTLLISGNGEMANWKYVSGAIRDVVVDTPWYPYAKQITKAEIGKDVVLGERTFQGLSALETFTFPETVTVIPQYTFADCVKLANVTIPNGVTSIGTAAFRACDTMTEITIPESVVTYGTSIFIGCKSLAKVNLPESMTKLPDSIFDDCVSIASVKFPSNMKTIGKSAFSGCTALKEMVLPSTITSVEERAFDYSGVEKVDLSDTGMTEIPVRMFEACSALKEIAFPDTVKTIHQNAFLNCGSLENITLPEGLVEIESTIFEGCESLTSIDMSNTMVETIHRNIFAGCTALTDVKLSKATKKIETKAFEDCSRLVEIVLPEGIESLVADAFNENIKHIDLSETSMKELVGNQFKDYTKLEKVILPKTLEKIGAEAFVNTGIQTLMIPESVNWIEGSAFGTKEVSSQLKAVVIPTESFEKYVEEDDYYQRIGSGIFKNIGDKSIVYFMGNELPKAFSEGYVENRIDLNKTSMAILNGGDYSVETVFEAGKLAEPVKEDYVFKGWYDNKECTGTAATEAEAGKTYYAKWGKAPQAKVYLDGTATDNGDGTESNPYNNFKAAMDGVAEDGTIELVDDYVKESATSAEGEQNRVQITKDITMELNQHKIYASGNSGWYGVLVNAGVTATVQNGDIVCNKPSSGAVTVQNGGIANIINCTVKAEKSKPTVHLNAGSTLIGSGTTFVSAPNAYYGLYNEAKKIHLMNCTVDATGVTSSYYYGINVTSADMTFEDCIVNVPDGEDAYELVIEDGNTATISGGEINGALRTGWESNGTLKVQGDTLINGQVVHVGNGTNNIASRIELDGGKYALTENLISTSLKDNIVVSGGLFKNETVIADFVKDPYKIIANTGADSAEYPYTIQNIPEGTVACVGNNTYTSLEDAIVAAGETETILLVANVETDALSGNINGNGKTITYKGTLDALAKSGATLTNANVKCSDADISNIALSSGKLNGGVVNSGDAGEILAEGYFVAHDTKKIADVSAFEATIGKTGYAFLINATTVAAQTKEKETVVLQQDSDGITEEVMPKANYILDLNGHTIGGVMIVPQTTGMKYSPDNADITITDSSAEKTGKIVSEDNFAVATNGTLENVKLTLDGVTVESKAVAGIYFPSSGKLTVKDSSITGASGIEIRGGELEVENSEITAIATEFEANENNNGSTITGAAIAISQHATNHDIKVEIKSGTLKGIKALYENDLQDEESDNIEIVVTGGTFDGKVESNNVDSFIKGGTFTQWPGETLVAEKTLAVQNKDVVHIGDNAGDVIADVQSGEKIIVLVTGGKDLVVPEGVIVENNTGEDITVNGEEVAHGANITAHIHKAEKTEAKAATCTEAGNIAYWYCKGCDKYFKDADCKIGISKAETVVSAKGHKAEKTEAKAATCTEAGNIAYWYCKDCDKYFKDADCKIGISKAETVVSAKGHKAEKTEAKAATCAEAGNIAYWYCKDCDEYFSDAECKAEISKAETIVKAIGHTYNNRGECAACGELSTDRKEADKVDALISAIGSIDKISLESRTAIVSAREAYEKLTIEQRKLVVGYENLLKVIEVYNALLEEGEKPIEQPDQSGNEANNAEVDKSNATKTGDTANVAGYMTVMMLAAGTVVIVIRRKRRV